MNNKYDNLDKILNTYSDSDPRVLQIVGDIEKYIADSKINFEDVEEYLQSQNWCSVCKMQIENRETFQQHLTNHSLTCQDCEKRFSRKDALKRHQKMHVLIVVNIEKYCAINVELLKKVLFVHVQFVKKKNINASFVLFE